MQTDIPNLAGKAITVRGVIDAGALGFTLPHEHLFIDLSTPYDDPARWESSRFSFPRTEAEREVFHEPFCICRSSALRDRMFGGNRDALILNSVSDAIAEVSDFARSGGGTIVDVTTEDLGRRPLDLVAVSEATGVQIIMGTGYYRKAYHPSDIGSHSVDQIAAMMVTDIVSGALGTGIRAGVIGELGAEDFAGGSDEVRILQAAARASRATGAPISLHNQIGCPQKWHSGPDILQDAGADLNRVIAGHITGVQADLVESLIRRGLYAEFDTLGFPFLTHTPQVDTRPNLGTLLELIRRGHAHRLLLSQDVCTKFHLHKNGGAGYDFVLTDVIPFLVGQGVSREDIDLITRRNPARIFGFVEPGRV